MTIREYIENEGYEDVIIFDNPSYDDAFIGITTNNIAVYDFNKMVEWLIQKEEMSYEEAVDFIYYNESFCYGEKYPIILFSI